MCSNVVCLVHLQAGKLVVVVGGGGEGGGGAAVTSYLQPGDMACS